MVDLDKFTSQGVKISPSERYYAEIFKTPDGIYTFCVKTKEGLTFYNPVESDGVMYSDEQLDWAKKKDLLFFTTNHLHRIFLFDLEHFQFYSTDVPENHGIWWEETENRWHIKERLFSSGGKDFWGICGVLGTKEDPMLKEPENKIIDIPDSKYSLWLQKYTTHTYDRKVWKIAVFTKSDFRIIVEDLGYYAIENSLRQGKDKYYNFYGFRADEEALCVVNFCPDKKFELYVWECPPHVPMCMEWVEEEMFWRAVINHTVIRPRPFYFDNLYSVPLKTTNISIPLELTNLLLSEHPEQKELQELRKKLVHEQQQEILNEHEQQNTSSEELISRAYGETQLFQRLKAKYFMPNKHKNHNPKRRSIISFIVATVLLIAVPVAVAFASANGWRIGGVTLKNIAGIIILLATLWIASLTDLIANRKKK